MALRFNWRRSLRIVVPLGLAAAWGLASGGARASVLLISLPDRAALFADENDDAKPDNWPGMSEAGSAEPTSAEPIVKMAPEISAAEPTADWKSQVNALIFAPFAPEGLLSEAEATVVDLGRGLWDQLASNQTLQEALAAGRAAMELEQSKEHSIVQQPLAAAPPVGTSIEPSFDTAAGRSRNVLEGLASVGRSMLTTWTVEKGQWLSSLPLGWGVQREPLSPAAALDDWLSGVSADNRDLEVERPSPNVADPVVEGDNFPFDTPAANAAAQPSVPLSALAKPLARHTASALNDAAVSLKSLAAQLTEWSDRGSSTSPGSTPAKAASKRDNSDATSLLNDPAAPSFFEF